MTIGHMERVQSNAKRAMNILNDHSCVELRWCIV